MSSGFELENWRAFTKDQPELILVGEEAYSNTSGRFVTAHQLINTLELRQNKQATPHLPTLLSKNSTRERERERERSMQCLRPV